MKQIKQSIECWLLLKEKNVTEVLLLEVEEKEGKHPVFFQPITGGID